MNKRILTLCSAALLISVSALTKGDEGEKAVKMKDLPSAVQKTVREQSKGAIIRGLSKETEDGKTVYEVEMNFKGHTKDVLISAEGDVLEVEEAVALASLPAPVREGIKKEAGSTRIIKIESLTKGGSLSAYEVHTRTGKKQAEFQVGTDGRLIKKE